MINYNLDFYGCTDPVAQNYEEDNIYEDGSCIYGPNIISIYDVPQDQGGFVFINWTKNSLDTPTEDSTFINKYSVWRHIPSNRGWEFLDYVDAYSFDEYAYTAPTIETSTIGDTLKTTYKVLAHTENQQIFFYKSSVWRYSR